MKKEHNSITLFNSMFRNIFNPVEELDNIIAETFPDTDSDGYDLDEDGNRLSCCGDILDPDYMICPTCREHC